MSFSGTLAECRAQKDLPDGYKRWAKSDYSSCEYIEDHSLGDEPGKIYNLAPAASLFSDTLRFPIGKGLTAPRPMSLPLLAVAIGFVAGLIVGVALDRSLRASAPAERS